MKLDFYPDTSLTPPLIFTDEKCHLRHAKFGLNFRHHSPLSQPRFEMEQYI